MFEMILRCPQKYLLKHKKQSQDVWKSEGLTQKFDVRDLTNACRLLSMKDGTTKSVTVRKCRSSCINQLRKIEVTIYVNSPDKSSNYMKKSKHFKRLLNDSND